MCKTSPRFILLCLPPPPPSPTPAPNTKRTHAQTQTQKTEAHTCTHKRGSIPDWSHRMAANCTRLLSGGRSWERTRFIDFEKNDLFPFFRDCPLSSYIHLPPHTHRHTHTHGRALMAFYSGQQTTFSFFFWGGGGGGQRKNWDIIAGGGGSGGWREVKSETI